MFLVYDPSKTWIGTSKPLVSNIGNAIQPWEAADVYYISTEVKFSYYGNDSVVFFPISSNIPQISPVGHPVYAA